MAKSLAEKLKLQKKAIPQKREERKEDLKIKYVPPSSMVQVERKLEQDTQFRTLLQIIGKADINNIGIPVVNDGFRLFQKEKRNRPKLEEEEENEEEEDDDVEAWNDLSEQRRYKYVLEAVANRRGLPSDQKIFVSTVLIPLSVELLRKFIEEYTEQNASYKEFYSLWRSRSDIVEQFLQVVPDEEKVILNYVENRIRTLKEVLHQLVKEEATRKNINVEKNDTYYDIIDKLVEHKYETIGQIKKRLTKLKTRYTEARNKDNKEEMLETETKMKKLLKNIEQVTGKKGEGITSIEKLLVGLINEKRIELHKEVAKDYLKLAKEMNLPDTNTLIDLVNTISKEENRVYSKLSAKVRKELLTKTYLVEEAKILGIDPTYTEDAIRYHIAKQQMGIYKPSLDELKKVAENLGIRTEGLSIQQLTLSINKYNLEHRPELVKRLEVDEKLVFDEEKIRKQLKEKHKDWKEDEIKKEIERLRYDYNLIEPEKQVLVKKIHEITGESTDKLYALPKTQLEKLYSDVRYRLGLKPFDQEQERERIKEEWTSMSESERKRTIERIRSIYMYVSDLSDIEAYMTVRLRQAEEIENELWVDKLINTEEITRINPKLSKDDLEDEIDKERTRIQLHEHEILVNKLHMITSEPVESLATMSLYQLREKYLNLEKGDEYWEEDHLDKDKKVGTDVALKKCLINTISYNWVSGRVSGVWLSFSDEEKKTDAIPYFYTDHQLELPSGIKPSIWYRANSRFMALQCNKYAKMRTQKGKVLKCYDEAKNELEFHVGFTSVGADKGILIPSGLYKGQWFIIQDENLFVKELQSRQSEYLSERARMKAVLYEKVNDKSMEVASQMLSAGLRTVAPKVKDYGVTLDFNTPYIRIVVNTLGIKGETRNLELFNGIANIIAYLHLENAHTFKERIRHEYYLPDILPTLSPSEKLPEVFENPNIEEKEQDIFSSFIQSRINAYVKSMASKMVRDDVVRQRKLDVYVEPSIKYKKNVCVNGEDISKINKNKLIFYREPDTNKIYCLDVDNVLINFQKNNFKNPHTGKEYSPEFLQMYIITYVDTYDMKTYSFPYFELLDKFKKKDIVNSHTNRPFSQQFIDFVMSGPYNCKAKYSDIDNHLTWCQNPQDARFQPVSNIVYYKDTYDNQTYCFAITKLFEQFMVNNYVNPRTGRLFSSNFVKRFNELFNVDLHKKGLLQDKFQTKYGKELIPLISKELLTQKEKKQEEDTSKIVLIIPDLWKLVQTSLTQLETQPKPQELELPKEQEEQLRTEEEQPLTEEEQPRTEDVKQECKCKNCSSGCTFPKSVKTVWWNKADKKFDIISFCNLDCMEDYQKWDKEGGWKKLVV